MYVHQHTLVREPMTWDLEKNENGRRWVALETHNSESSPLEVNIDSRNCLNWVQTRPSG